MSVANDEKQRSFRMPKNVLGGELEICCMSPRTGFFRDGVCRLVQKALGKLGAAIRKPSLFQVGKEHCQPGVAAHERPAVGLDGPELTGAERPGDGLNRFERLRAQPSGEERRPGDDCHLRSAATLCSVSWSS